MIKLINLINKLLFKMNDEKCVNHRMHRDIISLIYWGSKYKGRF